MEVYIMENILMPLNLIPIGSIAKVKELTSQGISRRRMLDLGLVVGTEVESLRKSPSGEPMKFVVQ
jgi:ferrous iron transport protein A